MSILLTENKERFSIFPIKYHDIWKAYKDHQNAFWVAEEIDYGADVKDYEKLTDDEQYFIKNILAFFAESDGIVVENLVTNFCSMVQLPEARCFYTWQAAMEQIHGETYSLLIDTFVKDKTEKIKLFNAIEHNPIVAKKAEWAEKWIKQGTFTEKLVAFAIVEGIFFSGSFCAIFWLRNRGLMTKALGKSNELIARDEGLHTDFAILLYTKYIDDKLTREQVYEIMKEAVEIEREFICGSLPCRLIGMNSELMYDYIKYVADRLLTQLGYEKIYNTKNPFKFMELTSLDGKTNFFEERVTEYTLLGMNEKSRINIDNLENDEF